MANILVNNILTSTGKNWKGNELLIVFADSHRGSLAGMEEKRTRAEDGRRESVPRLALRMRQRF